MPKKRTTTVLDVTNRLRQAKGQLPLVPLSSKKGRTSSPKTSNAGTMKRLRRVSKAISSPEYRFTGKVN